MTTDVRISIIVAVAENGVIGRGGELPWHLSADLKRFKKLTMGHTIVMGRRTWESIGRPLPGRRMVVVTRRADYRPPDMEIEVAGCLDEALRLAAAAGDDEAFIIGGRGLFHEAITRSDRLHYTRVHAQVVGDTRFPEIDWNAWKQLESIRHEANADNDFPVTFEIYERSNSD